jgi:hypothetical protein
MGVKFDQYSLEKVEILKDIEKARSNLNKIKRTFSIMINLLIVEWHLRLCIKTENKNNVDEDGFTPLVNKKGGKKVKLPQLGVVGSSSSKRCL